MPAVPGAAFIPGNEDCLYVNVYAPPNAAKLPVLVYIHEGGYGYGDGTHDMTEIINANDRGFVAVTLQYRVSDPPAAKHKLPVLTFPSTARRLWLAVV
jgi:acetyl esterase/lipase